MSEQEIISYIVDERISSWETDMSDFFRQWNEWASSYRMIDTRGEKRPVGVSRNLTAETPRAVNTLASTLTTMQVRANPFFELRGRKTLGMEQKLFDLEDRYNTELSLTQFTRKLMKGNRGLCLFGTQVWEEPLIGLPFGSPNPSFQGTDFNSLSLLQVAFEPSVYDIEYSDFLGKLYRMSPHFLRYIGRSSEVWNRAVIEEGIKEMSDGGTSGFSESAINQRRQRAGYQDLKLQQHEIILWEGKGLNTDLPMIQEMWSRYGMEGDPRDSDITVGILDRKRIVRLHPTPYGTWHHSNKIGHYIEFELEPMAYGVGSFGAGLQKDMNRIISRVNDTELFSLFNMFLIGQGAELKPQHMNIFPFAGIPVRDVNQVKEFRPQIEGIINGLKLNEFTREDFRGVTHATSTLQALITGASATEAKLAQGEALRALSLIAAINNEAVVKPHIRTMHINYVDQNIYDQRLIDEVDIEVKALTDDDFRPEHSKQLLELYQILTSIRNDTSIEINPDGIIDYLARAAGVNPRELRQPRKQTDRLLAILKKLGNAGLQNEVVGEQESSGSPVITEPEREVPTSPLELAV